jgi:hypothetical protein
MGSMHSLRRLARRLIVVGALVVACGPVAAARGAAPPETTITAGPQGLTTSADASFGFASNVAGASFECRLDGDFWNPERPIAGARIPLHDFIPGWGACDSPKAYVHVDEGEHEFEVRAAAGGLVDPTPASRSFTVQTGVEAIVVADGRQRQRGRGVAVELEVLAREAVGVAVAGRIRLRAVGYGAPTDYPLDPLAVRIEDGDSTTLRARAGDRSAERSLARALRHGRRARAMLTVDLDNELGNEERRSFSIGLRGRR